MMFEYFWWDMLVPRRVATRTWKPPLLRKAGILWVYPVYHQDAIVTSRMTCFTFLGDRESRNTGIQGIVDSTSHRIHVYMVYLPTWMVDFYGKLEGVYLPVPWIRHGHWLLAGPADRSNLLHVQLALALRQEFSLFATEQDHLNYSQNLHPPWN